MLLTKGAVKETVDKVTGDAKTEADGAAEKTAGKVQNAIGGAKDAALRRATVRPSWLNLSLIAWHVGLEAQQFVGLRLAKLLGGGHLAATEATRMTSEKLHALWEGSDGRWHIDWQKRANSFAYL